MKTQPKAWEDIKAFVRSEYGQAARQANNGTATCCGSASSLVGDALDPITANLYHAEQTIGLPDDAVRASFGCGNPTMLVTIQTGATVLDLGSGRYRRAAGCATGGAKGQSIRPRHDRRDAGIGPGKPT